MNAVARRLELAPLFIDIIKHVAPEPNATILDIGCGALCKRFHEAFGDRYLGTDVEDSPHPKDEVVNAEYIPYVDGFDVVTAWSVIEHVENPMNALRSMTRASKHYVLLSTDLTENDKNNDPTHLYSWTPTVWQRFLMHPGYKAWVWSDYNIMFGGVDKTVGGGAK